METTTRELERIIARMQRIQRAIRTSGQPPSISELTELQQLGREYARLVERLAGTSGGNGKSGHRGDNWHDG